jgi:hypothetical protein
MKIHVLHAITTAFLLFAASANAAPMAYAVNSDGNPGDSLYLIDLATGVDQLRGNLFTGIENRTDTEGLAFSPAPNSRLWGIDDDAGTLFPIDPANGSINFQEEIQLPAEFQSGGGNDFGMSFACDNSMYFTSVVSQTLYRRDPGGAVTAIGAKGSLGVNISAISAIGNPTRLYGLGNGQLSNGATDAPNLYQIDTNTGVAKLVGPLGAPGQFEYQQAGMGFDSNGGLWAITDRSQISNQKSQILKIDVSTGAATLVSTTLNQVGYESLAIAPPTQCGPVAAPGSADGVPRIPTLSLAGSISAIVVLLLTGMTFLRRRYPKSQY